MSSKSKIITKAIRLSAKEEAQINEFLNANSFFDFSTLARTAILGFIREPTVSITPIASEKHTKRRQLDV